MIQIGLSESTNEVAELLRPLGRIFAHFCAFSVHLQLEKTFRMAAKKQPNGQGTRVLCETNTVTEQHAPQCENQCRTKLWVIESPGGWVLVKFFWPLEICISERERV